MNLYYNHEHYAEKRIREGKGLPDQFMRSHISKSEMMQAFVVESSHFSDHCVDALRERISCTADIGVVAFLWRDEDGALMPDFEREHKCHDHKAVISWYKENALPASMSAVKRVPPPEAVLHPPTEFI